MLLIYRDFELAVKTSHLAGVLENVFCGSSDGGVSENRDAVSRYVHDQVHSTNGISTPEVLVLAFHVLQVATRALARGAIQCMKGGKEAPNQNKHVSSAKDIDSSVCVAEELIVSPMKGSSSVDASLKISMESGAKQILTPSHGRFFVPQTVLNALPFPTDQLLLQVLQTSGRTVIAETCLRVRDICMTILWKVEDTVVIRRCLGIMTEVC